MDDGSARSGGAVAITTTLHAKPGCEEALVGVLRALAGTVRREEAGCLLFEPVRSRHEASRFVLLERYRDERALSAHANSAHLRDALPGLMDCLASPPELVVYEALSDEPA